MSMPELIPENHEQIYDYLRLFEPNPRLQRLGFALMRATFKSEVHFDGEAESMIHEHVEQGGSLIVAPNHQSNADTPTVGALGFEPCFRALPGATTAPGKAEMFGWPVLGKHMFPHLRIHPIFRGDDFSDDDAGEKLHWAAVDSAIAYNIDFINSGGHVAIFPEGRRNKSNPRVIQEIKTGIARIALGVDDPQRVLVVPMGIAYKSPKLHLRPLTVVREPFCAAGTERRELLARVGDEIQAATTRAFDLVDNR